MPLPGSRDFDAVDAGPLPHTTVNNLQDAIVALEAARIAAEAFVHGEQKVWYGAPSWQGNVSSVPANDADYGTSSFYDGWFFDGINESAAFQFGGLPVGTIIKEAEFFGNNFGGTGPPYDSFDVELRRSELRAFTTTVETAAIAASDTDPLDLYLKFDAGTPGWPFTLVDTHVFNLRVDRLANPDDGDVRFFGTLLLVDFSNVLVHT